MTLTINGSSAAAAPGALASAQAAAAQATERLSSGRRINSARDDAAGLAIASHMTAELRGLNVASRNSLDAVSLVQTASGALGSIGDNLQRLRELAVQAANATNSASDRAAIQAEASQLVDEIDRVAMATRYNGQSLLDGSFAQAAFQVGADGGQTILLPALGSARAGALGSLGSGAALPVTTAITGSTLTAASTITGPGQLVVNGVDIWQGSNVDADAKDLAAAIAAAGVPGLSASAAANVAVGTSTVPGAGSVSINGGSRLYYDFTSSTQFGIAFTMEFYLNNVGIAPGVSGANNGVGVTLTAADGRNIALNFGNGGVAADVGFGGIAYGVGVDGITYSHVGLSYTGTQGLSIAGSHAAALGLPPMTGIPSPPSTAAAYVSGIDLSTVAGATAALGTLDASLATVDSTRALLGASQNRFSALIDESRSAAANVAAARSRIVDADFGAEAAALVRAQILQQAGVAMVAQANSSRRDVLQLL